MEESDKNETEQAVTESDLELDDQHLEEVAISDTDIVEDDKQSRKAARQAKKMARKARTPEQRKHDRRKQLLIAGAGVAVVIGLVLAVPASRWWTLNLLGFRGKLVLSLQRSDKEPVANATVRLDSGQYGVSDEFGRAYFSSVRLGRRQVNVEKTGYGRQKITVTAGLGTTRPPSITLKVIGIKFDVTVKDWLSKSAISGATVTSSEIKSTSDKNGLASVVVPPTDEKKVSLKIDAPGYLTKTIEVEPSVAASEVSLVSSAKNYFVSKRDGQFDIFSSNLDGSNQQKIIQATGAEQADLLQFTISRNNKQAILVATREAKQQNNRVITGIYAVDLEAASLRKIDEGSEVQVLDWADDSIIYAKSAADLRYDDASFSRLMSYNTSSGKLSQLASANYFPVRLVLQNKLLYAAADAYRPLENPLLISLDVASGSKKGMLAGKQWGFGARLNYDTARVQTTDGQNFEVQAKGTTKAVDQPPSNSLSFGLSPDGNQAAWADRRDGQGALIVRNVKDGTDRVVVRTAGLTSPVRWINDNLVVVRVVTSQETADYVVHVGTGKLAKIVDVTNVGPQRPETL